jgi:hypothetical protein
VRQPVKAIEVAAKNAGVSPLLPLVAGLLIALFTVSLAMAEPSGVPVAAVHGGMTVGMGLDTQGGLESDALTPADTAIASRPLHPSHYLDRYEFYHRYDHGLTSRYSPLDDGTR